MFLQAVILMAACTADEYEYCTDRQCYFSFDTSIHNVSILNKALNPLTSGVFCQIRQEPGNGIVNLKLQLQDGRTSESVAITTADELRRSYIIGASNGIVVGYSSLSQQLYAFDMQCPNCLKENYPYTKYPLLWDNNGLWLRCGRCSRSYDLNSGGVVVSGEGGLKLLRYRADYGGRLLVVHN